MGILTVAVVTKPFSFEGIKRMQAAESGIDELAQNVDSVIVILNEKLEEVLGGDVSMEEAFGAADNVLKKRGRRHFGDHQYSRPDQRRLPGRQDRHA